MNLKPIPAIAICLVVAAFVGYFVAGHYAVMTFIGLDPSAFPAGPFMQSIGEAILPSIEVTLAGVILFGGCLLLVAILSFFFVRSSA